MCRFEDFDNERSLALHRIQKAQVSTLAFERPDEFDLQKYDEEGRFGFGEGQRIALSFNIEKGAGFHLSETPLSTDQEISDIDEDWMQIKATVVNSAMLEWWLRGFGNSVNKVRRIKIK